MTCIVSWRGNGRAPGFFSTHGHGRIALWERKQVDVFALVKRKLSRRAGLTLAVLDKGLLVIPVSLAIFKGAHKGLSIGMVSVAEKRLWLLASYNACGNGPPACICAAHRY